MPCRCRFVIPPYVIFYCADSEYNADQQDIVDEALLYFKANILFRNFDVTSNSDRLLIYLTLYISACLKKVVKKPKVEAEKILYAYALENFALPGDANFVLGGLVSKPATKQEAGMSDWMALLYFIG